MAAAAVAISFAPGAAWTQQRQSESAADAATVAWETFALARSVSRDRWVEFPGALATANGRIFPHGSNATSPMRLPALSSTAVSRRLPLETPAARPYLRVNRFKPGSH